MVTELDLKNLKKKVIKIYEDYLAGKDVSEEAERIYSLTFAADPLLEKKMIEAINIMFWFTECGKEVVKKTGMPPLSKKRVKKILEELRKSEE